MFSVAADPKSAFSGEPRAARGQTASTSTTQITGASTGTSSPQDWETFTPNFSFGRFANHWPTEGARDHLNVVLDFMLMDVYSSNV